MSQTVQIESPRSLDQKVAALEAIMRPMGRVLIGYSGGVDSALLAVAARRVLGDGAIAVTADSESYASGELEAAAQLAQQFDIRHEVVKTRELDNPDYASNPVNRCYFCKQELFLHMERLAGEMAVKYILYGQNADDVGDFRPGAKAAREHGVRAPLQEAGMSKEDVRALARQWGIPVWDRPAMACLSSRFPYGTPVTAAGLKMVDRAERFLRDCGFEQLRVRHHTDIARIELPADDLNRLLADALLMARLAQELSRIGYVRSCVDLQGFRSGSMNEVLKKDAEGKSASPDKPGDADLGLGQSESEKLKGMLVLRFESHAFPILALATTRRSLLESLEDPPPYVAVDLAELDS